MSGLQELYQQVIIDHSKRPRNFHAMPDATSQAEGHNPLCGDRVTVYLMSKNNTITDVSFTGSGCAICTASASMMTQFLKGQTVEQAQSIFSKFRDLVMGAPQPPDVADALDKLAVFSGVRKFPIRIKCATLAWHAMMTALECKDEVASTE